MTPAELIEKALHQHFALRLTPSALEEAQRGHPLWLSGAQAEDAARIAVDALASAGLVVAAQCACGEPIGTCHSCGQPRCWHCDPGLGKGREPMKCNRRHEPARAALPEEKNDG